MYTFKKYFIFWLIILSVSSFLRAEEQILPYDMELKDATLSEILKKIEKCFAVRIGIEKEEKDPIDFYFAQGQSLDEILKMLAEVSEKKLEKISDKEYFFAEKINLSELETKEYHLEYLHSEEVVKILKELYSEKAKIASLSSGNKVIVVAEKGILLELDQVISEIDFPQKQVKIQSQILDISKDLFQELGFDWLYDKPHNLQKSTHFSLLSEESSGEIAPVLGSKFNLIRQFSNATEALGLSFRLLEAKQDLRVSSSPSLIIANGAKGEFKITEEVIVGEKKEKRKGENISVEPIFKEAGLILQVTPQIHEDLSVTLEIRLEVSDFKYRRGLSSQENWNFNAQGGSKIGRSLTTKVRVQNGETILIGGLRRSSNRKSENKVPVLGDIPLLKYLFRAESNRDQMADMYIKIYVEVC